MIGFRQLKRCASLCAILFGIQSAAYATETTFCENPDTTILTLTDPAGDRIVLDMTRYTDAAQCPDDVKSLAGQPGRVGPYYCLRASAKVITHDGYVYQGWASGLSNGDYFYLEAFNGDDAHAGPFAGGGMTIQGQFDRRGTAVYSHGETTWTATTVPGCMNWPDDRQVQANCTAAAAYSRGLRQYVENRGGCGQHAPGLSCNHVAACDPTFSTSGFNDYIAQCVAVLAGQQPKSDVEVTTGNGQVYSSTGAGPNDPVTANCDRFVSNRDYEKACRAVISQDDFSKAASQECLQDTNWRRPNRTPIIKEIVAPADTPASRVLVPRGSQGDAIPSFTVSPNTPLRAGPDPATQVFRGGGGGDAIPSFGASPNTPVQNPTTFVPGGASSFVQPTNTPFRPSQIFNSGGGIDKVHSGSPSVLNPNSPGSATGARFGGCPPNTAPDGHGGCAGGGIDMVHSGGTPVLKPNTSGGASAATGGSGGIDKVHSGGPVLKPNTSGGATARRGVHSTVQPGGASVLRRNTAATTARVLKPGNTGGAIAPNRSVSVLRRGSPAANAFRNQPYYPRLK